MSNIRRAYERYIENFEEQELIMDIEEFKEEYCKDCTMRANGNCEDEDDCPDVQDAYNDYVKENEPMSYEDFESEYYDHNREE